MTIPYTTFLFDDLTVELAQSVNVYDPPARRVHVSAWWRYDGVDSMPWDRVGVIVEVDDPSVLTVSWAAALLGQFLNERLLAVIGPPEPVHSNHLHIDLGRYDPDRDIAGPLMARDVELFHERHYLAEERARRQTDAWKNPARPFDPTSILDEVCACGHPASEHYRERGECMASTPTETWACSCHEYQP